MWQAQHVKNHILSNYPKLQVEIIGITTEGDRILDKSLSKIGGKGLFIKELEQQLLCGIADIAVHSLKDLPANLSPNFSLAAILPRENPYDAFVSNKYLALNEMPAGSIIGTSSARREAVLKKYYPQLQTRLLRGNLPTRLNKLDNKEYDAVILAVAGLKRLELETRIKQILPEDEFTPAIGQGALAIEICSQREDLKHLLSVLNDSATAATVGAEREMGRFMNASCNIPIAGFAKIVDDEIQLQGMLADSEEGIYLTAYSNGKINNWLDVGQACAYKLLEAGAGKIIEKYAQAKSVD